MQLGTAPATRPLGGAPGSGGAMRGRKFYIGAVSQPTNCGSILHGYCNDICSGHIRMCIHTRILNDVVNVSYLSHMYNHVKLLC